MSVFVSGASEGDDRQIPCMYEWMYVCNVLLHSDIQAPQITRHLRSDVSPNFLQCQHSIILYTLVEAYGKPKSTELHSKQLAFIVSSDKKWCDGGKREASNLCCCVRFSSQRIGNVPALYKILARIKHVAIGQ